MRTVWKIAPGEKAFMWPDCKESGVITINWHWLKPGNFATFKSVEEIREGFRNVGDPKTARGSASKSIFAFANEMRPGHVVIANHGLSRVEGIGVITSEYLKPTHPDNPRKKKEYHRHLRLVDWVVTEPVDLDMELFHQNTVQKLEEDQWREVQRAYVRKYPKLKRTIREVFDARITLPDETRIAADVEAPPADRVETTISRIIRDTKIALDVKRLHNNKCQVLACKHPVVLPDGTHYVEAHHIQPLGKKHNGPDVLENLLCLCPNHHAACDLGAIKLNSTDLREVEGHKAGKTFLSYHNKHIHLH